MNNNTLYFQTQTVAFRNGNQLTNFIFDEVEKVNAFNILYSSNLLLIVKEDGTPVLYDKIGENGIIEPLKFDSVLICEKGIKVTKYGLSSCYSFEGKVIIPFKYAVLNLRSKGIEFVENGMVGLFSYDGKLILPAKFNSIINFYVDKIELDEGGNTVYYSYDGRQI